jgi:Pyruvate/2-oxoacid:ferredoxin oxidoreductase gamma subunit
LFLLNNHALDRLRPRLHASTVVYGAAGFITDEDKEKLSYHEIALTELAKQSGNRLYINTVLFGFIAGLLDIHTENARDLIRNRFLKRGEETVAGNIRAFELGYDLGVNDPKKPARSTPGSPTAPGGYSTCAPATAAWR